MKIHYVKSNPEPFKEVWAGAKQYEVRNFDREYAVGDRVYMLEFDETARNYTGRYVWCMITHLTAPKEWSLPNGLCVFGFELLGKYTVRPETARAMRLTDGQLHHYSKSR